MIMKHGKFSYHKMMIQFNFNSKIFRVLLNIKK